MRKHLALMVMLVMSFIILNREPEVEVAKIPMSKPTDVELFMDEIAKIETPGGDFRTVSQNGMLGRYQFAPSTVRTLGFKGTPQQFLNNRQIQDKVMLAYMKSNQDELISLIRKYDGKIVKGIRITRASILAGAHFAGSTNVRMFFINDSNDGPTDGNGTTLRTYMARFSHFKLPILNTNTKVTI